MGILLFGILMLLFGLVMLVMGRQVRLQGWLRFLIIGVLFVGGLGFVIGSTALYVNADEGGIITKKFGASLKEGHIVAINGERGVQADVLSPGWSFWWWPFLYGVKAEKNKIIPQGKIGMVTASDGKPLPEGEVYAPEWESVQEMMDARLFLTKQGCRGPQLTVLPPTTYRYNPKLFTIEEAEITDVKMGEAAVVRANVGKIAEKVTDELQIVNGVPLVPKGSRGIWNTPLFPGQYYMHPKAYEIVHGKTTKRVYSYTGSSSSEANAKNDRPGIDNSIHVRSSDSFQFPVDVRVAVFIKAQDMPYIVAKFGNPDTDVNKDGFDTLETKAILPSIRAILRNSSENQKAIQYVNSRSKVESDTFEKFSKDMEKDKIEVEAVYLADIRLDSSDEGKSLLKTQTDMELALQQQMMYKEQVRAEEENGKQIEAATKALQNKDIQESLAKVEIAKNEAEAAKNKATGDAAAYESKKKALTGEGVENLIKLEIAKLVMDNLGKTWNGNVPNIVQLGGNPTDSLNAYFAQQLDKAIPAAVVAAKPVAVDLVPVEK